jgi:atlastin
MGQLRAFVPRIVDPKNMAPKEINGEPVTCRQLFVYFKAYAEIFSGETLPEPKSLLTVTYTLNY